MTHFTIEIDANFILDEARFDNREFIDSRVAAAPQKDSKTLRSLLTYITFHQNQARSLPAEAAVLPLESAGQDASGKQLHSRRGSHQVDAASLAVSPTTIAGECRASRESTHREQTHRIDPEL